MSNKRVALHTQLQPAQRFVSKLSVGDNSFFVKFIES